MDEIDPQVAKRLFEEGGVLIFLGVPTGTHFGVDMKSWFTDEYFRGIKMIPPGIHFISFSAVNNVGEIGPRSGFFHNFRKGEVIVKKWDLKEDDICCEDVAEEEIVRLKHNIKAMDRFLGPYPFDIYEKWISLTESITEDLLNQIVPLSGIIRSALELEGCSDADRPRCGNIEDSRAVKRLRSSSYLIDDKEDCLLPQMKPKYGTDIRLTAFPDKSYPDGSTPSDITHHSLDFSYNLDVMLSNYKQPSDIIGEIQFTFISFLIGHSLEAFEQWKKLINLFCSCERAITKYRRLYDLLLSAVKVQIVEVPEEFLADIVTNNNFFYMKIRDLFRNIYNSSVDGQLKSKMERFKEFLNVKFSWDFSGLDGDDEEDAPVVVHLEEYQLDFNN